MTNEEFTKKHWKQGSLNEFEKDLTELATEAKNISSNAVLSAVKLLLDEWGNKRYMLEKLAGEYTKDEKKGTSYNSTIRYLLLEKIKIKTPF